MVWQNIKGLELDEKLNHLEKTQFTLYLDYQELLMEYEKIRNSDNIKRFAKDNLGMIKTSYKDFIQLGIANKQKVLKKYFNKNELEN
ncbi:MAG: hypothetical protein OEV44_01985 [Spirochaetota bacterium]|nr:hypothetical protein [Spirochaetota bacterium]